jgi:hypothetical protein
MIAEEKREFRRQAAENTDEDTDAPSSPGGQMANV